MNEIKLLSCPFCDGDAELKYDAHGSAYVKCKNKCIIQCGTGLEGRIRSAEEAIALWNTRVPSADCKFAPKHGEKCRGISKYLYYHEPIDDCLSCDKYVSEKT